AISSGRRPSFSSQSKKPSPASPAHKVPSQSKAAIRSSRRRTEAIKSAALEDEVRLTLVESIPRSLLELRRNLRQQSGVFLRRIYIRNHERIVHGDVLNVFLILVLYIARSRIGWSSQKCLNHLASDQNRMPVLPAVFRDHHPLPSGKCSFESGKQGLQRCS